MIRALVIAGACLLAGGYLIFDCAARVDCHDRGGVWIRDEFACVGARR